VLPVYRLVILSRSWPVSFNASFDVLGVVFDQPVPLLAGQLQGQRAGNTLGNRVLDREYVRDPLVKLACPKQPAVPDSHTLRRNPDPVARFPYRTFENRLDWQLSHGRLASV
jgi:hypothetical protein